MTDFIRKDPRTLSDEPIIDQATIPAQDSTITDPDSAGDLPGRIVGKDANPRTLITPPPAETRSTSVSTGAGTAAAAVRAPEEEKIALFSANEADNLRRKWDSVQVQFVDAPRKAVEEADALVSATMKRLAEVFAEERSKLEQQWDRNEDVSTEDFRLVLQRYRSFFSRLLTI